jgi:uncharacterized protein (DUF111 family)
MKKGISGVDVRIEVAAEHKHEHGHSHSHHEHMTYSRVRDMILAADLSEGASKYALDIFTFLGTAEAEVHGTTLNEVGFHEVGSPSSLIDIIGTAVAADMLGAERILCGAVRDGNGTIECAHGIIPVPVPAVVSMTRRSHIPLVVDESVATEMVTPSGYAILNGLGAVYADDPIQGVVHEGYGFGKRDTGRLGAVKALINYSI